jgi:hypothetical protein
VHPHGVDIGAIQQALVGTGIVGPNAVYEFILAQELARFGLGVAGPGFRVGRRHRRGGIDDGERRRLGKERVWALEAQ